MHCIYPLLLVTALASLANTADTDPRRALFGRWGTPAQCAGDPIKPGGTVMATPFEIDPGWLQHGQLWCKLAWGPIDLRKDAVFTGAHAQCGEDSVRGYFLGMTLENERLTLRWQPFLSNGPLGRCPPL